LPPSRSIRRARAWAEDAALRLWVVDAAADAGAWIEARSLVGPADWLVLTKADLPRGADAAAATAAAWERRVVVREVSSATGEGVAALAEALAARLADDLSGAEFPAVTRERHAALLTEALTHLRRGQAALERPELAAEDLRLAGRALARVAGRIGAEDILDRIFASFCIGK